MAFDFLFAPEEKTDRANLVQGDLLLKTPALSEKISIAHPYYSQTEKYTHFMVLTQSCDLVLRGTQKPKADYITLAAVRPLQHLIERRIKRRAYTGVPVPIAIYPTEQENQVRNFLERLLHNTEDGFFYLPAGSHTSISADLVAFLQLSISIRTEHYRACLDAKIAQLSDVFQAKVGWLAGNLFSRVATPDFEESEQDPEQIKKEFFDQAVYRASAWLSPEQLRDFKKKLREWKVAQGDREPTVEETTALLGSLPSSLDLLASRAVQVLVREGIVSDDPLAIQSAETILKNDDVFRNRAKYVS